MVWEQIEDEVRSVEGYLLDGQDRWLFETAQAMPDGVNILEVGGYLGRSTAALAFGCVETEKQVWTIDTFCGNSKDFREGTDFRDGGSFLLDWRMNIARLGLSKYASALVGPSSSFWQMWDKPIHFLFIDGSHQYEDVLGDLGYFYRSVVPSGVVAIHDAHPDYPWPGPYRVWCELGQTLLENIWNVGTMFYGQKPVRDTRC